MKKGMLIFAAALAASSAMAADGMVKLSALSASPAKYYDKTMCVKARINSVATQTSGAIKISVLQLAYKKYVVPASAKYNADYAAGNDIAACGKFRARIQAGTQTLSNALEITSAVQDTPKTKAKTVKKYATTTPAPKTAK